MKNIENRLKISRQNKGLTQLEVAKELDITDRTLKRYEQSAEKIPLNIVTKMSSIYGVNLNWLLTGKGEMLLKDEKPPTNTSNLSDIEQKLLDKFKELPKDLQEIHIKEIDRDLLDEAIKEKRKKRANNQLKAPNKTDATA